MSGQTAHHYQLFVEHDPNLPLPSVQDLFDQSFNSSRVKLRKAPPVLILQMPRLDLKLRLLIPRFIYVQHCLSIIGLEGSSRFTTESCRANCSMSRTSSRPRRASALSAGFSRSGNVPPASATTTPACSPPPSVDRPK